MKALKLAASGATLAIVTAGLVWATRTGPSTVTPTREPEQFPSAGGRPVAVPAAASAVGGPATRQPSTACLFTPGQRFAYAASAETSWALPERLRTVVGSTADGASSWSAELHFEVLKVDTEGAVLVARLSDVSKSSAQAAGEGLTAAWLARVNPRCEVAGFAHLKTTPAPAARAQQSALHELWFTVPDADTAAVDFLNATGEARGVMSRGEHGLVRRIDSYPATWSRDMAGLQVTASSLTVQRGKAPWFDSMSGREAFTASSVERGHVALSVASTPPRAEVLADASRTVEDYVWENLLGPVLPRTTVAVPVDHEQRVAAMRDVKFEAALDHFTALADTNQNIATRWPDMAAFLDAHPEHIEDFSTRLITDFEPHQKVGGFLALGQAQNPAAREALLEIWRERGLSMMDRTRASLALVTRADVGAALARELRGEAARRPSNQDEANVSRQAMLHLGVLAGTRPDNQEVALETREAIGSALASAKTPEDTSVIFAAIGNTGDATYLPELQKWSQDRSPEIRATVALGMRRMPVEAVRDFTVEWLRRETHPDVKREIFEVVQHQYQDAGQPIGEALLAEAVGHLRQQPRILTRESLFRLLEPHAGNELVRAALRDQLKVEYERQSGLFAFVAGLLPERDVQAVLTSIPTLHDQLGTVSPTPPSSAAQANALPDTPPEGFMPPPPTAAELEGSTP